MNNNINNKHREMENTMNDSKMASDKSLRESGSKYVKHHKISFEDAYRVGEVSLKKSVFTGGARN